MYEKLHYLHGNVTPAECVAWCLPALFLLCSYWSGWLSSFSSVWLVWPIESEAPKPTTRLPTRCQRTMSTTTTISTGWQVRLFGLAEKPRSLIILPAFPSSSGLTAFWHMIFYQNSLRLRGAHSGPIWGPGGGACWLYVALCGSMWLFVALWPLLPLPLLLWKLRACHSRTFHANYAKRKLHRNK